ncbi:MAG: HAD family phosphatase [Bacteroidota bacterium]
MPTLLAFDLDGTLIQSEALKAISYGWAAHQLRPDLPAEAVTHAYGALVGNSRETISRTLLGQFDLTEAALARDPTTEPWRTYVGIRLECYRAMLEDADLLRRNTHPEALQLARHARRLADRVALVTTSERWAAGLILDALGLQGRFDTVVTADDVPEVKPDPAGYRLALARLGVSPEDAIAIEDSPSGARAVLAAGLAAVIVPTRYTREPLRAMANAGEIQPHDLVEPGDLSAVVRARLAR